MRLSIKVTIQILSDFHLGTGAGRGRTVDAMVLRDEDGVPYLPASSLKGLARWHAEAIVRAVEATAQASAASKSIWSACVDELFGKEERLGSGRGNGGPYGFENGETRGQIDFDDARSESTSGTAPVVHGHSARDRNTGRSADKKLYFAEDAAAVTLETQLSSRPGVLVREQAVVLLLLALRRIEAVGGQRRRGKGRARVSARVKEAPPGQENLKGLRLPVLESDGERTFKGLFDKYFSRTPTPSKPPNDDEAPAQAVIHSVGPDQISSSPETRTDAEPVAGPISPDNSSDNSTTAATNATGTPPDKTWTTVMVFAHAKKPLVLGYDQGVDNIISSLDFIPGSTLRGATAALVLQAGWDSAGPSFQDIFVREQVQFGPLYPTGKKWNEERTFPLPTPLSFQTCKDYPGVVSYDNPAVHGLRDLLRTETREQCGKVDCGAPLTPQGGYLYLEKRSIEGRLQWQPLLPRLNAVLRTEIDLETARGADERLYATESIPRGQLFVGYLWGPAWAVLALENAWGGDEGRTLHVGKCQTRGHGEVQVWLRRPTETSDQVYPLLYPGSGHVGAGGELAQSVPPDGFTITCYSDLIAVDDALRPIGRLDETMLWWLLNGDDVAPFQLVKGFARSRQVSGFNGLPRAHRTADQAIAAGSVWRFTWTDVKTTDRRPNAWSMLARAHHRGLGLRRGEGFGRIMLDLPWHKAKIDQLVPATAAPEGAERFDWEVDVAAGFGRPRPALALQTAPKRFLLRGAQPSPLRKRRGELTHRAIAKAIAEIGPAAPQAAARWLYQASLSVDPWTAIDTALKLPGARPGKHGRDSFTKLLVEVQKSLNGTGSTDERPSPSSLDGLPELLRDLAEALVEPREARQALPVENLTPATPGEETHA